MARQIWRREELLLALNLYCRLPFGHYHDRNPEIIQLAELLGRTAGAVAMKLSNFASFDPYHQSRGIKGLQNSSRADRDIWDEFNSDWDRLAIESETIYAEFLGRFDHLMATTPEADLDLVHIYKSTEIERLVKARIGQQFFRKMILTSYRKRCCVCGMPIPELLIASHIIPWRDDEKLRVNPHNGLCFCALHDKGFDRGYFTLGYDYEVVIGKAIREYLPSSAVHDWFERYTGEIITFPDKFMPEQAFIAIHREKYFLG